VRVPGVPGRLRSVVAAVLGIGLTALGAVACLPAQPPVGPIDGGTWVALGDSFSSGQGAGQFAADESAYFDPGTRGTCDRSPYAYSRLLGRADSLTPAVRAFRDSQGLRGLDYTITHVACSGATIPDVLTRTQPGAGQPQIAALTDATSLITISIGGNDVGFGAIGRTCLLPPALRGGPRTCQEVYEARNLFGTIDALRAPLARLYADLARRAQRARVLVVGYPQLVGAPDAGTDAGYASASRTFCSAHLFGVNYPVYQIPDSDRTWLRLLVDRLDGMIADAAADAAASQAAAGQNHDIGYVDVESAFEPGGETHSEAFCGTQRDLNGAIVSVTSGRTPVGVNHNSLHPTRTGYAALAARLAEAVAAPDR
jgi:lysophospholipase L1-like esterase